MSSYTLTEDECNALAFGLDHHIPARTNKNIIGTEFGLYFRSINRYVNEIPVNNISHLKTKLRNICDRYNLFVYRINFGKQSNNCQETKALWFLKKTVVE